MLDKERCIKEHIYYELVYLVNPVINLCRLIVYGRVKRAKD